GGTHAPASICRQSTPTRWRKRAMTVGFGLIGSGMMGRTYSAAIQRQAKDARVVAVTGGSRAPKLAAEFGIAEEPSVEALLGRKDVDVVVIATPHSTHLPLALAVA